MKFLAAFIASICFALSLLITPALAQDESYYFRPVPDPKDFGTILFSVGPTKSIGDMASYKSSNLASGNTEVGFSGSVTYLSPTLGNIGFIVRGVAAINPIDKGILRVSLEDELRASGGSSSLTTYSVNNLQSGNWSHLGGFGGINLSIPSDRITFEARFLGGYMMHERPSLSYEIYTTTSVPLAGESNAFTATQETSPYKREASKASALAIQAEIGFRYDFRKGTALGVSLGYLTSKPEMEDISTRNNVGGVTYSQPINMLYLQFGLGINLGDARR